MLRAFWYHIYMKSVRIPKQKTKTFTIVGLFALILICVVITVVWRSSTKTETKKSIGTQTHILTGTVTSETPRGLVDAGHYLYLDNNVLVRTSNKGSRHIGPNFDKDTSSINIGDKVEARYVDDSDGRATLNCSTCYIKKIE